MNKQLFIFDFDCTISNTDSDRQLIQILDNFETTYQGEITWLQYMQAVCDFAQKSKNIDEIKLHIQKLELTSGIQQFIQSIYENSCNEIIIISGGNTLFINWVLEKYQINHLFSKIYASKGEIIDGKIILTGYYSESQKCGFGCQREICKQKILKQHLDQKNYQHVFYIGDGSNDLCPISTLGQNDYTFAREDYPLDKLLKEKNVKCQIKIWKDGFQMQQFIREL